MRRTRQSAPITSARRGAPWRRLLVFIIVLTLPCYCVGGLILTSDIGASSVAVGEGNFPWLWVAVALALVILITEPWHGIISTFLDVGINVALGSLDFIVDPIIGCGVLLFLLIACGVLAAICLSPQLSNLGA